jgi:hypothetical protein
MLADAVAQYLVWKQWRRWLLVVGSHGEDKLYGDARSAARMQHLRLPNLLRQIRGGVRSSTWSGRSIWVVSLIDQRWAAQLRSSFAT